MNKIEEKITINLGGSHSFDFNKADKLLTKLYESIKGE